MKWIRTVELPRGDWATKRYRVETMPTKGPAKWPKLDRPGVPLGTVKWHTGFRRFAFFPLPDTVYEPTCLRDLADFCEEETKRRKDDVRHLKAEGLAR